MVKNQIVILSVKKALGDFGTLVGTTNPEYKIMKYLLRHFYQNEMLRTTPNHIAQQLKLSSVTVTAFIKRLIQAQIITHNQGIFYLNTNFVLNK